MFIILVTVHVERLFNCLDIHDSYKQEGVSFNTFVT